MTNTLFYILFISANTDVKILIMFLFIHKVSVKYTCMPNEQGEENQVIMHLSSPCADGDKPQSPILSKYLLQVSAYADIKTISVWSIAENWSWEGL